jgi:hypothetical protein
VSRVFLLSPASASGERARLLLRKDARFDLAMRLRRSGAPLGEAFAFLSGLYFRGKLAYARAFASPPAGLPGVLVITPGDGLVPPDTIVTAGIFERWAAVPIDADEPRFRLPLERHARALAAALGEGAEVVLLGSIASDKYGAPLGAVFGERLLFPPAFVGRGDMSRGGLLLRCVEARQELEYAPLAGAARRGRRPPKLAPRPRPERS